MKIKKGGKSSSIPMPKRKAGKSHSVPMPTYEPKHLPIYKPKPLPKAVIDNARARAKAIGDRGKNLPDLDKIIKRQESGGYSKTYRK